MSENTFPGSWTQIPIEDCLLAYPNGRKIRQGWSPQCESYPAETLDDWGVLKTSAIQDGEFVDSANKRLPQNLEPRTQLEVEPGDILMTCAGPRSRCGVACLVRKTRPKLLISGKMYQLRVDPEIIDRHLLELYLRESSTQKKIDEMKTGISDSGLNLTHSRFATLEIPLPPLAEQRRIVAKIEELFSELDAGEESLRRARRQLGVYRQSLLKQAFEGKLTAHWRKENPHLVESPAQLLKRVEDERQSRQETRIKDWKKSIKAWEAGKSKGKKPIKPREAEVVPLTQDAISCLPALPPPWIWTSLSQLSDHIVDGTHKTPKYVENGVQFISAKDINDFTISFANTKFITTEEHDELWRRCKPCEGDILLTKSGTIGRVAVVKTEHEFSVFESVAVIPISRSVEPQFFAFQIFCTVQGTFGAANQKGVGVRHLHLEDIRRLPTSLPSLPEQQEIVRLLDEQFTVIEQNERELDAALKRSAALRQSILKKAFTGQLVPQDPTDEPASILLERIRKERDYVLKVPKKKAARRA